MDKLHHHEAHARLRRIFFDEGYQTASGYVRFPKDNMSANTVVSPELW